MKITLSTNNVIKSLQVFGPKTVLIVSTDKVSVIGTVNVGNTTHTHTHTHTHRYIYIYLSMLLVNS